jgi:hypothetical protein
MRAQILSAVFILWLAVASVLAAAHTPQPGSEERKAICDALRRYVIHKVAVRPPPEPIVFKVDFLRVDGDVAWFEGIPMLKSGGFATDYLPDMGYAMVLKKSNSGWQVVHDLSRSDVPDDAELIALRNKLAGVPTSIVPDFWRPLLKR